MTREESETIKVYWWEFYTPLEGYSPLNCPGCDGEFIWDDLNWGGPKLPYYLCPHCPTLIEFSILG